MHNPDLNERGLSLQPAMEIKKFDIIIIGAGPAGCASAIMLAKSGIKVALIEKAVFPRDKVCGDALSIDVINQLAMLSPQLAETFSNLPEKTASYGIKIFAPSSETLDIPFIYNNEPACGFISPRLDFDNLIFGHAKKLQNIDAFESCEIDTIKIEKDGVRAFAGAQEFRALMIIGADGAQSIVAKKLAAFKVEKEHYTAGLRVYYENVTQMHPEHYIELHFFKEVLPGYLWIFPLPGNRANVGIGVQSSVISKKKINLKETLQHLLTTNEHLKVRFSNAQPMETVKGYGLPLGSKKRKISGERFLLTGDAASMIDPLSGEGIGNAIRCGRIAAAHVLTCLQSNNFSASFNSSYDKEVYRRMWRELSVSRIMQKVFTRGWVLNLIVRKAIKSNYLRNLLTNALGNTTKKKMLLLRPKFYWQMLK